jgi:hypothetical protein
MEIAYTGVSLDRVLENVKMSDELPINLTELFIWGKVLSPNPNPNLSTTTTAPFYCSPILYLFLTDTETQTFYVV